MGVPVTVDSDDLETLIFMCSAVGKIEQILNTHKADPATRRVQNKFGDAHTRIAKMWRGALRGGQHPIWNEPVTDKEKTLLIEIATFDEHEIPNGAYADPQMPFINLSAKGMIEGGTPCHGVKWHGYEQPELRDSPKLRLRVTQRAIAAVPEILKIIEAKNEEKKEENSQKTLGASALTHRSTLQTEDDQEQEKGQEAEK